MICSSESTSSATKREPTPGQRQLQRHALGRRDAERLLHAVPHAPSLGAPASGGSSSVGPAAATPSTMHPDAFAAERGPAWDELAGSHRRGARSRPAASGRRHPAPRRALPRGRGRSRLRPAALRRRSRHAPARDARAARAAARLRRVRAPRIAASPTSRTATGARSPSGPKPLLAAWLLMLVPALLAGLWALSDPSAAGGLVPADYRSVAEPHHSGPRPARRGRARRRLDRHLREQHPGHVPGLRRRASRSDS